MKQVKINLHIFSRHLGVRLPDHQHLIFNLLSQNGQAVFQIVSTDNQAVKQFCQQRGRNFKVKIGSQVKVASDLSLVFK